MLSSTTLQLRSGPFSLLLSVSLFLKYGQEVHAFCVCMFFFWVILTKTGYNGDEFVRPPPPPPAIYLAELLRTFMLIKVISTVANLQIRVQIC